MVYCCVRAAADNATTFVALTRPCASPLGLSIMQLHVAALWRAHSAAADTADSLLHACLVDVHW
jgi:hypothetical protein